MRFHLIDRINSYVPNEAVRGRKLTSHSEEYWETVQHGLIMLAPPTCEGRIKFDQLGHPLHVENADPVLEKVTGFLQQV